MSSFEVVFIFEILLCTNGNRERLKETWKSIYNHLKINHYRKSDGRKYSEGVTSIKDAEFPFPASVPSDLEVGNTVSTEVAENSFGGEIAILQSRLHEALAQLEQSNSECVQLAQQNVIVNADLKAAEDKCKKLVTENSVLRRRLSELSPGEEGPPRPGPSRKSFENLTPRIQKRASDELQAQVLKTSEERGILPHKLTAFLTYR